MNHFEVMTPDSFDFNPFQLIGKEWMAITTATGNDVNAMTASWGGMGVMWGKNVVYIVVRDSRYTKELLDKSHGFSISFFQDETYRKALNYLGTVSGREEDKLKKLGFTLGCVDGIPHIEEAKYTFMCRTLCCQPITPESFIAPEIQEKWYKDGDYHNLYIGEILSVLVKNNQESFTG